MNNIGQLKRVSQNRIVQFFQIDLGYNVLARPLQERCTCSALGCTPSVSCDYLFETNRRIKYPYK
ncbi:hypothetical protein V8167_000205 [Providencia rettgeri]